MNSQCPRCLSTMFEPVMAEVPRFKVPPGYRSETVPFDLKQIGCAFCDGADVRKHGMPSGRFVSVDHGRTSKLAAV